MAEDSVRFSVAQNNKSPALHLLVAPIGRLPARQCCSPGLKLNNGLFSLVETNVRNLTKKKALNKKLHYP